MTIHDSSTAVLRSSSARGRARVCRLGGETAVQICLSAPDWEDGMCRVYLHAPSGACMDMPSLPLCGGTGKMTYLEPRLSPRSVFGARIQITSPRGLYTAWGEFCPDANTAPPHCATHPGPHCPPPFSPHCPPPRPACPPSPASCFPATPFTCSPCAPSCAPGVPSCRPPLFPPPIPSCRPCPSPVPPCRPFPPPDPFFGPPSPPSPPEPRPCRSAPWDPPPVPRPDPCPCRPPLPRRGPHPCRPPLPWDPPTFRLTSRPPFGPGPSCPLWRAPG